MSARGRARRGGAGGVFNQTRVVGVVSLAAPSMAHGGAPPWLLLHASGEEDGVGRGQSGGGLGARGGVLTTLCRSAGRPRPRCRRTAAMWPAPGGVRRARPRAGEGEWAARASGSKGRRVGPAAPGPFLFCLNFFSQLFCQTYFDPFKILFRL